MAKVHALIYIIMGMDRPTEFELIARHFARLAAGFPGAYGLLDDAAVISPSAGCELVVKTDAIVGGVDFLPDTPADLIARKGLRVNLSDLAAKGAVPRGYLLDLILPGAVDEAWIANFAAGLTQDQAEYHVHLIGGDTSSTFGPITVAVTAFGETPVGQIIRRGGARPGDQIFVTGTIGDAVLGLQVLLGSLRGLDTRCAEYLVSRCRLPLPRVALGPHLVGIAGAAADVSDGLVADLGHICIASNLGAVVEGSGVPLSPQAVAAINGSAERFAAALTGGDDYEIVFTASSAAAPQIEALSRAFGVRITPIGRMTTCPASADNPVIVLGRDGEPMRFRSKGWTHFGGEGH